MVLIGNQERYLASKNKYAAVSEGIFLSSGSGWQTPVNVMNGS